MGSYDYKPLSQVNVTSLVDVTLVLLIVFMLAAPLLQEGVEVELPQAEVKGIDMSDSWIVSVVRNGDVYINEKKIPMDELSAEIKARILVSGEREVYVRGDAEVPYGAVVRLIGILKSAGIENVGLVSRSEEPSGARP